MLVVPAFTEPPEPDGDSWFEWIVNPILENIWGPILCAIKRAYCWLSDGVIGFGLDLLDALDELFPDLQEHVSSVDSFSMWLGLVDKWFPLTEGFTLLGGAIAWVSALILIRFIRRMMPF